MSSPDPVMRLMRLMTHANIGAAMGLVAWLAWSGWLVVSGQWPLPQRASDIRASLAAAPASRQPPMQLIPAGQVSHAQPSCHGPAAVPARPPVTGADL
jgi:hypothetical protein